MTVFNDLMTALEAAFDTLYSGDSEKAFVHGQFSELSKPSNTEEQLLYVSTPSDGIIFDDQVGKYGKGDVQITLNLHSVTKNNSGEPNSYAQLVDECNTLLFDVINELCANSDNGNKYKRAISEAITGKDSINVSALNYVGTRYKFVFTLSVC